MRTGPDVLQSITENQYELSGCWLWASEDIYTADYREILQQPTSLEATTIDQCRFKADEVVLVARGGPAPDAPVVFACTAYLLGDTDGIPTTVTDHASLSGLLGTGPEYVHLNAAQQTGLTAGGDTALHRHSYDRERANHTGTQLATTISNFGPATISATAGVYQPISAELSALAGLSSTGYAKRTGAGAWSVVAAIPQADVSGLTAALATIPLASAITPLMDGTAAVGTGTTWARADHVHPSDTSRLGVSAQAYDSARLGGVVAASYALASSVPVASSTTPSALGTAAVGAGTTWARADHAHAMPTAAQVGAEPALGNPGTSGFVLSSTTGGVRSWVALPSVPVSSVFGRTGAVVAASGDYSAYYLGLTAQAADSAKLGGKLPGYYATAASLGNYLPLSAGSSNKLTALLYATGGVTVDASVSTFWGVAGYSGTIFTGDVSGDMGIKAGSGTFRLGVNTGVGTAAIAMTSSTVTVNLPLTGTTATFSGGQLSLTNTTSNLLTYSVYGIGLPTSNTRSKGTKICLYPSLSASKVDHAIGIADHTTWFSVEDTSGRFEWYASDIKIASLLGDGVFNAKALRCNGNTVWDVSSLQFAGTGSAATMARSDHNHSGSFVEMTGDQFGISGKKYFTTGARFSRFGVESKVNYTSNGPIYIDPQSALHTISPATSTGFIDASIGNGLFTGQIIFIRVRLGATDFNGVNLVGRNVSHAPLRVDSTSHNTEQIYALFWDGTYWI